MSTILLFTHVGLCAGIFYACFCRLVKMTKSTSFRLRVSVYLQSLTSSSLILAPFAWGLEPGFWMCLLLTTTLVHFYVMGRIWVPGVPDQYLVDRGPLSG